MAWGLELITAPAAEPLTAALVKTWLKQDGSDDDTLIGTMIVAARQWIEDYTHRALITQTWELTLDEFPSGTDPIYLPLPPIQSITSIKYDDEDGTEQTWDSSNYRVDISSTWARVTPAFGESYPATRVQIAAVRIRYVAGYGDAASDVPDAIKQAMYHLLSHWYEERNPVGSLDITAERQVNRILNNFTVVTAA